MNLRILRPNEDKSDPLFKSEDCQQLLVIYDEYYPKVGFNEPWVAYLIIEENQVLGTCSFVQKPENGKVEIAYWTFKSFEGKGVASFACNALIELAQESNPEIEIVAKTAPEKNASTRILEKNGFAFKEVVQDKEIGDAWLWTLTK